MPKFKAQVGGDVDLWIIQVSAIYSQAGCSDDDLLQSLPSLFKGKAAKWFATLTKEERDAMPTWDHWEKALRRAHRAANFDHNARTRCYERRLGNNEFFADYYQDTRFLQRYAFAEESTYQELIADMMSGIPPKFHPTLKCLLRPWDQLEELRRYLIDCEQGLRPWMFDDKGNPKRRYMSRDDSESDSDNDRKQKTFNKTSQNRERKLRDPPGPCDCGGMHWRRDCPKKANTSQTTSSNYSNSSRTDSRNSRGYNNGTNNRSFVKSDANSTPLHNNRWTNNRSNKSAASANTVLAQANPVKTRRQQQAEPVTAIEPVLLPVSPAAVEAVKAKGTLHFRKDTSKWRLQ